MGAKIELHIDCSSYAREVAVILNLAFSGDPMDRWRTIIGEEPYSDEHDIPHLQLERDIRDIVHQNIQPGVVSVAALIDGQVAGIAVWLIPRHHWRIETLSHFIFRRCVEYKDKFEDWWHPKAWVHSGREQLIRTLRIKYANEHLGNGELEKTWYLKTLAVLPALQRKGVGTALVKWGMEQAAPHGEKVYVDSSYVGKPMYAKLGFKEVGGFVVGDSGVRVSCMLWDSNKKDIEESPSHENVPS